MKKSKVAEKAPVDGIKIDNLGEAISKKIKKLQKIIFLLIQ